MDIIVFSDSHGRPYNMESVLKRNKDARYVLFLGDGEADIDSIEAKFPDKIFLSVRGNNDYISALPYSRIIEIEGKRIFMAHGHTFGVKYSLSSITTAGLQNGADIILFGHTHQRYEEYDPLKKVYIFNPGSVGEGYMQNGFGVITIKDNNVLLSHGEV